MRNIKVIKKVIIICYCDWSTPTIICNNVLFWSCSIPSVVYSYHINYCLYSSICRWKNENIFISDLNLCIVIRTLYNVDQSRINVSWICRKLSWKIFHIITLVTVCYCKPCSLSIQHMVLQTLLCSSAFSLYSSVKGFYTRVDSHPEDEYTVFNKTIFINSLIV